jgi:hypothetical protein
MNDLLEQFRHWLSQPATNEGVLLSAALIVWLGAYFIHNAFKVTFASTLGSAAQKLEQIEKTVDLWQHDWKMLHDREVEDARERYYRPP